MPQEQVLLILSNIEAAQQLERSILRPDGYEVILVRDIATAETLIHARLPDLIILEDQLDDGDGLELSARLLERYPTLPIIFFTTEHSASLVIQALQQGLVDYLIPPLRASDVSQAVSRAKTHHQRLENWARHEVKRNTESLQTRLKELEALQRIGRSVSALLDLDGVLTAVVDAAVELTGAEEGSLLLQDESSGELFMRAARNFQEDFVRTFRLPVEDTLPGQVLRTGKPLLMHGETPQIIKTAYQVHTLIYVPLIMHDRVIGVLGVDNRRSGHSFSQYHLTLVSALADYAAIAIENSRLYVGTEIERSNLETILTKIKDGVLVVDHEGQLILINRTARATFELGDEPLTGKPIHDVIRHPDLLELIDDENVTTPYRGEIRLDDGRVFNAQATPIPEVGLVITMQNITHLKELDRIKSDFVSTISHDLRSPLTAILGYVELIDRVGPITEQQREFIRRVQASVHNITALISDLLDLGQIEAGFDVRKEAIPLSSFIRFTVDSISDRFVEKSQVLKLDVPAEMPPILGNPIRLRQMLENLIENAIKHTPEGGNINVRTHVEGEKVILQVSDTGPGIPPAEQPYIFDKFYRASNIPGDIPGTGLGLAIVKSIVENHQGRIWVDSVRDQGTTFTVVFPIVDP